MISIFNLRNEKSKGNLILFNSPFIFKQTVAVYNGLNNEFKMVGNIHWPNRDSAPPDMPKCGFNNEKCDNSE